MNTLYTPKPFAVDDQAVLMDFIQQHPFASMMSAQHDQVQHVSKTPVMLSHDKETDQVSFELHLAKANPHVAFLQEHPDVGLLFDGPHDYISPLWYREAHPEKQVPTWNYSSVWTQGKATVHSDAQRIKKSVMQLSRLYEIDGVWEEGLDPEIVDRFATAIVCIQIKISTMQGVLKLSQNKNPDSLHHITQALNQTNPALAKLMKKHLP